MPKIIARNEEISTLDKAYKSNQPEFIAVYGRRRVGKTFLIKEHFKSKKNCTFICVTGLKDGSKEEQINNFMETLSETFLGRGLSLASAKNWQTAFRTLQQLLQDAPSKNKIVLFLDELPWMATKNARLLQSIEYFWNQYWSSNTKIKLIVCGSVSGWILKNIINNTGGLYNRVTETIYMKPFNLRQTRSFMQHNGVYLNDRQVVEIYMVLGGIPFYLSKITKKDSAHKIIAELSFKKNSFLLLEFNNLYRTLFKDSEIYIDIVSALAQAVDGLSAEDLASALRKKSGGTLHKQLETLVEADFIMPFKPFKNKGKGIFYKVIDEYTLFYLHWLAPIRDTLLAHSLRPNYWEKTRFSPSGYCWAGISFETICFKHLVEIAEALDLEPTACPSTWRFQPKKGSHEEGAQIDLLYDQKNGIIFLIEIKYTDSPFSMDKKAASDIKRKIQVFKERTGTKKGILFAVVSASGLKRTMYSEELISKTVKLSDLFQKIR